jgi:hypothetical protein
MSPSSLMAFATAVTYPGGIGKVTMPLSLLQ